MRALRLDRMAAGLALLAAGCGIDGDRFDYDRAHRDPFAYFATVPGDAGSAAGAPSLRSSAERRAVAAPYAHGGALGAEADAARRETAADLSSAMSDAAARRDWQMREAVGARANDRDVKALEAAQRRRERAVARGARSSTDPVGLDSARREAAADENALRRAIEIDAQRRAAADDAAAHPDPPGPFEVNERMRRGSPAVFSVAPASPRRSRAPGGALPDIGSVDLP